MAISRKLPCLLTEEDILDRGKQLASAEGAYVQIDLERKAAVADFKTQLSAVEGRINELATAIRDRVETRDVDCAISKNFHSMRNELIRSDTGEVVESYEMSEAERQGSLL